MAFTCAFERLLSMLRFAERFWRNLVTMSIHSEPKGYEVVMLQHVLREKERKIFPVESAKKSSETLVQSRNVMNMCMICMIGFF